MSSFATTNRALVLLLISALGASAEGFMADSVRGERLFQTLSCVQCHSVNGVGGSSAPDLGRMVDRAFTPGVAGGHHVESRARHVGCHARASGYREPA